MADINKMVVTSAIYSLSVYGGFKLGDLIKKDLYFKGYGINHIKDDPIIVDNTSNFNINRFKDIEFGDSIINFYNVLSNNFSKDNLITLRNNLSTLKLKDKTKNKKILNNDIAAYYNPLFNNIVLRDENSTPVINHELFHTSSTITKGMRIYTGFGQNGLYGDVFRSITEGYTELLRERYFTNEGYYAYKYERYITGALEQIVGKEKMEKLYFNSSTNSLIMELAQYSNLEDIKNFFIRFNYVSNYLTKSKKNKDIILLSFLLRDISYFLVNAYMNKLSNDLSNGKINKSDVNNMLSDFSNRVILECKTKYHKYKTLTTEEFDELISKYGLGVESVTLKK